MGFPTRFVDCVYPKEKIMNIPIEALAHLVGSSPQFMLHLTDDQQKNYAASYTSACSTRKMRMIFFN